MASERIIAAATLVDSNVLIDVISNDPKWGSWSTETLERAANEGPLLVNPVIFAEVSVGFSNVEAVNEALPSDEFLRVELPWSAAFLAGQCFREYRKRGGSKWSPLPDFFIGAHAAVKNLRLLTCDRLGGVAAPAREEEAGTRRADDR